MLLAATAVGYAQNYSAKQLAGTWKLSDGKATLMLTANSTFSYKFQGLQSEQEFKGKFKIVNGKTGSSLEFKRDNGAGMPTRRLKSLSADGKTLELTVGTLTEIYQKQ